ncbi:MAG TPA: tetratricopeptide repeat protein [Planctomycetota bacterium]|nr:tetratricopeptide repeat protein [Planctomycetota bacterium]
MERSLILGCLLFISACQTPPTAEESFLRGNVLFDSGDPQGAISAYTEAIELRPRYARALNNRGLAHAELKQYGFAIADYDDCLALPDAPAEAHYNRGIACFHLGRKGEAVVDFTEALKLNPQYVKALVGRGLVFSAGGDRDSALSDFRRALEISPPDWSERKSVEAEIARLSEPPK